MVPLVGPSSIVLALMASGLEGQRFAFCGYLPRETIRSASAKIRELEQRSQREKETEIFIETPYRNDVAARRAARMLQCTDAACASPPTSRLPAESISTRDDRRMAPGEGRDRPPPGGVSAC